MLAVVCLSLVVISVDSTILNVALPSMVRELAPKARSCSGSSTPASRAATPLTAFGPTPSPAPKTPIARRHRDG